MKHLYTTVCNDAYTNALTLLLWTIKRFNPSFAHPFKVYHKGDLSTENQARLRRVYAPFFFENVSDGDYQSKIAHYLALEAFREAEPEQVVFIDCDIICLGDISYLDRLDHPLSLALDFDFKNPFGFNVYGPLSPLARVNTGVFALNRTYRDGATYKALHALLKEFPDEYKKGVAWSDQGIVNQLFRWRTKFILPYYYNARKNLFKNRKFARGPEAALRGVRLLHFGGAYKPFLGGLKGVPPESKHHKYSQLHQVYYSYWDRMVADLQVDWKLP